MVLKVPGDRRESREACQLAPQACHGEPAMVLKVPGAESPGQPQGDPGKKYRAQPR